MTFIYSRIVNQKANKLMMKTIWKYCLLRVAIFFVKVEYLSPFTNFHWNISVLIDAANRFFPSRFVTLIYFHFLQLTEKIYLSYSCVFVAILHIPDLLSYKTRVPSLKQSRIHCQSYKTDIDFCDCFRSKNPSNTKTHKTHLDFWSRSRDKQR